MYHVIKYVDGRMFGVVSGMGRNAGTWDTMAHSKRTAQRWAAECRRDAKPGESFRVVSVFGD